MELIWSTATFKPLKSTTSSESLVWFSNAMWYWKPEQPARTTATRSATGTGVCMDMISFTFTAAVGVRLIIIFIASTRGILRKDSYVVSITQVQMAQSRVSNRVELPCSRGQQIAAIG